MVRSIQESAKLCEEHMQPATMGVLSVLASADNAVQCTQIHRSHDARNHVELWHSKPHVKYPESTVSNSKRVRIQS
jgi:hypothetical protein